MYNEAFEQWYKTTKSMNTPLSGISKALTDICHRSLKQQFDIMGDNLSRTSDQLKQLGNIKKPEDVINLQKECLNSNMTAAMDNIQKMMKLTTDNMEAMSSLFSQGTQTSNKSVKESNK